MVIGIDYGSKMAGTTAAAFSRDGTTELRSSVKNQDADRMILQLADELSPKLVAIDAPLSLPGVYTHLSGYDDYFYRVCDRQTKAMSPMFLGGLTARAMKLASQLRIQGTEVIEAYPVLAGNNMGLKDFGYRTKKVEMASLLDRLRVETSFKLSDRPLNGHETDAVLALWIGEKYMAGEASIEGEKVEGLIYY